MGTYTALFRTVGTCTVLFRNMGTCTVLFRTMGTCTVLFRTMGTCTASQRIQLELWGNLAASRYYLQVPLKYLLQVPLVPTGTFNFSTRRIWIYLYYVAIYTHINIYIWSYIVRFISSSLKLGCVSGLGKSSSN